MSEFLFGIGNLPRSTQNQREWSRLRSDFFFVGIDVDLAEEAATLRLTLRRQGWQLKLFDALIAVTALRGGYTLLTTDKDFRGITNLPQENWRS